jgi:large subunit ribosomal protein L32
MVVHMRHTSGHTANRRSHHALKGARFIVCAKCHSKHLMHRVCGNCGTYRGRLVVDTMKKVLKAEKKAGHTHNSTKPEGEKKVEKKKEKAEKKTKKEEVKK